MATSRCNEIPVIRGWTTGSGECAGLENQRMRGGTAATWPVVEVPVTNAPDPWWQDEETNLFVTLDDGVTYIELA
jgi:hypothetical protein